MAWKPEVYVEKKWSQNGLVFATKEEAEQNARNLLMRWSLCEDSRAVEVDAPVNYRWVDGKLQTVEVWMSPAPEKCDICKTPIVGSFVDGRTNTGPWACMCLSCHEGQGSGLGMGKGQKYEEKEGRWLKTAG